MFETACNTCLKVNRITQREYGIAEGLRDGQTCVNYCSKCKKRTQHTVNLRRIAGEARK